MLCRKLSKPVVLRHVLQSIWCFYPRASWMADGNSAEFSSMALEVCLLCQELVLVQGVRFHLLTCSFTNHQLQNQNDFHHEAEDAYLCLTV